jgi:hypothetical protein
MSAGFTSYADSIRVGDVTYDNVYVVKGQAMYYVSLPKDGTVLNVDVSQVDPATVKITENKVERRQLFDDWSKKNRERLNLAPPVVGEVKEAPKEVAPINQEPKRLTISAPPTDGAQTYNPARQMMMQQIRNKNAVAANQRRQRELDKFHRLNQVRVYTSADSGGAGRSGTGGYGGSTGSTAGGGMGGMGGMGRR